MIRAAWKGRKASKFFYHDKIVREKPIRIPFNLNIILLQPRNEKGVYILYRSIIFLLKPKSEVAYLFAEDTLRQGLEKMHYHHYTAIPVIRKDGTYYGTVTEGDFLWQLVQREQCDIFQHIPIRKTEAYYIHDIVRKGWNPAVKIDATMQDLLVQVMDQNFVPVVDDRNVFSGIITRKDVIQYFANESFCQKESESTRPANFTISNAHSYTASLVNHGTQSNG